MKLREGGLVVTIIVVTVVAVLGYLSSKKFGHDNAAEEVAEQIIESQTGVDIDLTPDSPEEEDEEKN